MTRGLVGGIIGNVLEWYDFAVFGYFAPIIGKQFFPSDDPNASLLGALGVFAAAYVMRPIGGAFFGYIGDRHGRKSALLLSVLLMAVPTTLIGVLPTHAQIGAAAGVLLALLRLLQGLSVGGELVGSISFITETSPPKQRGFIGSWALASSTGGVMLGSLVASLVHHGLSPDAAASWGWRLPFLVGSLIAAGSLWMRTVLQETPDFERVKKTGSIDRNPVAEVIKAMPIRIFHVAALVVLAGGGFYLLFVWWPTLLSKLMTPPVPHALIVNTLSMMVLMAIIPSAGALSDVIGRRRVLVGSAIGIVLVAFPLFLLVDHGTFAAALAAQLLFALFMGGFTGPLPATMVEMFPARMRFSGIAVGYNLSLCIFGGTTPLVATWLVLKNGSILAAACYLSFLATVSLVAAICLPQQRTNDVQKDTTKTERIEFLRQHIQRLENRIHKQKKDHSSLSTTKSDAPTLEEE
ncbi:MFS transporter [Myxococcota bacterium]